MAERSGIPGELSDYHSVTGTLLTFLKRESITESYASAEHIEQSECNFNARLFDNRGSHIFEIEIHRATHMSH